MRSENIVKKLEKQGYKFEWVKDCYSMAWSTKVCDVDFIIPDRDFKFADIEDCIDCIKHPGVFKSSTRFSCYINKDFFLNAILEYKEVSMKLFQDVLDEVKKLR